MTYRLLSYNIRYGGAGREDALAKVIRACSPDLVVFQEATRPAVLEALAAGTSMRQWASLPRHSLGFMSKEPVEDFAWHRPRLSRHAFLEVVPAGAAVHVVGLHLSAVHAAWTERRRTFELRALLRTLTERERGFHVLAGDFNTLAPGELLNVQKLPPRLRALVWLSGGRIRFRTIQAMLDAGYADVFRQHHARAPGFTFPAREPHVRLDYVFVPEADLPRIRTCEVITTPEAAAASDHLPILAELDI